MDQKKPTPKYTAEFRERSVRFFRKQRPDYTSDNAAFRLAVSPAITEASEKLGQFHLEHCFGGGSDAHTQAIRDRLEAGLV